jgi:hypothetical protein
LQDTFVRTFTGLALPAQTYGDLRDQLTAGDTRFVRPAPAGQRAHIGLSPTGPSKVGGFQVDREAVVLGESWDMPPLLMESLMDVRRFVAMMRLQPPEPIGGAVLGVLAAPLASQTITPDANFGVVFTWEAGSGVTPADYLAVARSLAPADGVPKPTDPMSALGAHLATTLEEPPEDRPLAADDDLGLLVLEAWRSRAEWLIAWEHRLQPAITGRIKADYTIATAHVLGLAVPAGGSSYLIDLPVAGA